DTPCRRAFDKRPPLDLGQFFPPIGSLKSILHFGVGLRNDLAEFLGLRCNELAILRGGHDPRHDALRVQRLRDRPVAPSRRYDVIEARDDRARRGGGREQPEPVKSSPAASASGAASGNCGMRSREVTATARSRPSWISGSAAARLEKLMVTAPVATSVTAGAAPR